MKTSILLIPIISGFLLLTGCDNPKSTQWYKEHQNEMNMRYKTCESSGDDSMDCKNVREARFELRQGNAKVPGLN